MNYSRCSVKSVLDQVLAYAGQASTQIDATQTTQVLGFIGTRLLDWGWLGYPWSEVTLTEQRIYRAPYAAATAYAAPTASSASEVYYPPTQQYYQALQATTGNAPATLSGGVWTTNMSYWAAAGGPYSGPDWTASTDMAQGSVYRNPDDGLYYMCHTAHTSSTSLDATKFGILTVFDAYVAKDQAWEENMIGEILSMYLDNPDQERMPRRVQYKLTNLGAHVVTTPCSRWGRGLGADYLVPNKVYVRFRIPCPELRGSTYAADATYGVGETIYYVGTGSDFEGDFWQCAVATAAGENPATTPASWERLDFPRWLKEPVARRAFADWLRYGGARNDALVEDNAAEDALYQAVLRDGPMQGQVLKWRKG